MKNLSSILLILSLCFAGCYSDKNNYVILQGTVLNAPSDTIYIFDNYDNYHKEIVLDENNNFYDTLNISAAEYHLEIAEEGTNLFLMEGDDLTITLDYLEFDESIKVEGIGQEINNFLFERVLSREENIYNSTSFFDKDSLSFNHDLNTFFDKEIHALERLHLDSSIFAKEKEAINMTKKSIGYYYLDKLELKQLAKLESAPEFSLNNQFGEKVALSDLRGKLVFVDVWATWCNPCIQEIPALKTLQKQYKDKDIQFVGISIDSPESIEEWKNKLVQEEMSGIQLILDKGWKSDFKSDYAISGIPRFILIDRDGKFIDVDAPRPSEDGIHELINNHL